MPDAALVKTESFLSRLIDVENPDAGTSPIYKAVQPDIERLIRVWMATPRSGNPLAGKDPETALANLVRFGIVTDLQQIIDSAAAVTQAFNAYFGAEIKAFAREVGEDTITATTPTKVFDERREAEIAEHKAKTESATAYLRKLTEVAATDKLGIVLTITPLPAEKQVKKPKVNPFKFLYVPVEGKGAGEPSVDRTQTFDWQTPAIFEPSSDEVQLFDQIYNWLLVEKIEPVTVKQGLEQTYNTDGVKLAALLNKLYNLASRQIEQSQKTLAYIEKNYAMYQGCMIAGLEVQAMVVDNGAFFGFTVGKGTSKKSTK